MNGRNTATRRCLASAGLAVCVMGCGSGAPTTVTAEPSEVTDSPTPAVTATATSQPTIVETPEATRAASSPPAATPVLTFESPFYRYAITLPPGSMQLKWRPAQRMWDGTSKIERAGPYTDKTAVAEGGIFLFGDEAESLDSWFARVAENGSRYHGCTPVENRVDTTINGLPAIAFTQRCALDTNMARVVVWRDGYGITMFLGGTTVDKLVATRDRAIELLSTLEWRTG